MKNRTKRTNVLFLQITGLILAGIIGTAIVCFCALNLPDDMLTIR